MKIYLIGIVQLTILISCISEIKPVKVFEFNQRYHIDSLNYYADSMMSFSGIVQFSKFHNVYLTNYIGPIHDKFPCIDNFPVYLYCYETITDENFNYIDPKPSTSILEYFLPTKLSLLIDTTQYPQFTVKENTFEIGGSRSEMKYNAYYLFIRNDSEFEVPLIIQDSFLFMVMEARDRNKQWHPIEYNFTMIPHCGTGVDEVFLKEDYYLLTKIPVYSGDFSTKIRIKIKANEKAFYSNEVNMKINKNQFKFPSKYFSMDSVSRKYSILDF